MEQTPRPRVTERVAQTAHETIDRVQEKAGQIEDQLRDTAERAAERARESGDKAKMELQGTVKKLTGYIEENPLQSAAIAFAAGLVVSSLLRRR